MKILVAVKRVVDYNIKVRAKTDGSDVDIAAAKMSINPFDEHAVEEAIRLKEAGHASEVVVVTSGAANSQDVLRHALAMGADRAILIETATALQALGTAKALYAIVQQEQPQLVLIGKQAIDDDAAEVGQMLAGLWQVAQASFASSISLVGNQASVTREIDGGQETIAFALPAVISADLRLNEPRYVKLPNLMQAKKKPIQTITLASLAIDSAPRLKLLNVSEPHARAPGIMVKSVAELVEKLHAAKVL